MQTYMKKNWIVLSLLIASALLILAINGCYHAKKPEVSPGAHEGMTPTPEPEVAPGAREGMTPTPEPEVSAGAHEDATPIPEPEVLADVPEGMVLIPAGWFWMGCVPGDTQCEEFLVLVDAMSGTDGQHAAGEQVVGVPHDQDSNGAQHQEADVVNGHRGEAEVRASTWDLPDGRQ